MLEQMPRSSRRIAMPIGGRYRLEISCWRSNAIVNVATTESVEVESAMAMGVCV